jgi:hypothetical protein
VSKGFNTFRVAFLMERLVPDSPTGTLDETYLGDLKKVSLLPIKLLGTENGILQ